MEWYHVKLQITYLYITMSCHFEILNLSIFAYRENYKDNPITSNNGTNTCLELLPLKIIMA